MVIRVLRDATVVASAVTAASAAAPESVTVAEPVTATRPAVGSDVPPVAEIVTVEHCQQELMQIYLLQVVSQPLQHFHLQAAQLQQIA